MVWSPGAATEKFKQAAKLLGVQYEEHKNILQGDVKSFGRVFLAHLPGL
jgi:hypothetical protein